MAAFAALAFPTFAFAAEGEKGGVSAILPDMLEFVPMVIVAFSCTLVSVALTIFVPNMLSKITDLI